MPIEENHIELREKSTARLKSNGALESDASKSLLLPIYKTFFQAGYSLLRNSLRLTAKNASQFSLEDFKIPDSKLAKAAETECRETLSPYVVNHSYRTFFFGLALAKSDEHIDIEKDKDKIEYLYVSSLLHDIKFESPNPKVCFAIAGAERTRQLAQQAGVDKCVEDKLYDAVAYHICPDIIERQPESLAAYVANGTILDLTGNRLWQLDPNFVKQVDAWWYRQDGFNRHMSKCWKRQADVFPKGRTNLFEKCTCLSHLLRSNILR
jgi:hypothetical protein